MTRRRAAGDAAGDAYDDSPDDQLGLFAATAMVPPVVAGRESPAPFADWSAVAAAIRATRERRRKVQTLAGYLGMLDERGAMQAVRWFSGAASPAADARPLRIGRSVLWPALADIAGITRERLGERRVALGSTAAVAAELLAGRPGAGLSLGDVAWSIDQLAHTTSAAARAALVRALLGAAGGADAEWLVAMLGGGLRIGLLGAQVEEAIALATGTPLDAVRQAQALAGDLATVLQRARHRTLAETPFAVGRPLGFMLAQPVASPEGLVAALPQPCAVEAKYDGVRAQLHVTSTGVRMFSRTGDDITAAFPEFARLAESLPAGVVLDGELVAVEADDAARIAPFRALQGRLGRRAPSLAVRRAKPVAFVAFDLLAIAGARLVELPWRERRERLTQLVTDPTPMTDPPPRRDSAHADGTGLLRLAPVAWLSDAAAVLEAFDAARRAGHEGLVAKHPDSRYEAGRRGRQWLKLKIATATLDVVITAAERGNGRRAALLSDVTFAVRRSADDATLLEVGKAYSGLTDAELEALTRTLEAHVLERRGGWHRVVPTVVLEVTFDLVQPSARHASGYALRFPRILRLRPDKPVAEIDTLARVRALAGEA